MALACKKDGIMVRCSWKKNAGGSMPENKTQQEWATMCRAMEEMRNETEHAKAIKVAKGMLQSGKLSYEEIAELSIDEVKALGKKV